MTSSNAIQGLLMEAGGAAPLCLPAGPQAAEPAAKAPADAPDQAPRKPDPSLIPFHDELKLAKVERAFLTVRELFKEWPRDHRSGIRFRRKIEYAVKADGKKPEKEVRLLEVRSDAPIRAFHLLLLEAVISMATHCMTRRIPSWQSPEGKGEIGTALRARLDLKHEAVLSKFIFLRCTYYELAIQMGRDPTNALRREIDEALIDLQGIRFVWRKENGRALEASNLISHIRFPKEEEGKSLAIGLSPSLSQAIVAKKPYTSISMPEARALSSSPAVILLGWLSSVIEPGRRKELLLDTVIDAVWMPSDNDSTRRSRKKDLLDKILPDLASAGWKCSLLENGKILFRRPKLQRDAVLKDICDAELDI